MCTYNITLMALHIVVVCGSVRKNRKSVLVANLIGQRIIHSSNTSTVVDFIELPLPFVDTDPNPSSLHKEYPYKTVQQWSAIADSADAFVFVAPEYNHGYSAVLKNALDWLYPEFNQKPVALVGVSDGLSGGLRAIEQLRPIMANFGMYDIQSTISIRNVQDVFDVDGNILDDKLVKQIDKLLVVLTRTAQVMRGLRE